jgi:hypothetical protein
LSYTLLLSLSLLGFIMHFLLLAVFVAFPTGSALSTTHQNLLPDKTLTFSSIFRSDFPICAIAVCEV